MQKLKWFKERVGKRIFRNAYRCCANCDYTYKKGLIINDEEHARIIFETQNDFEAEGIVMNYRDKK